MRGGEVPKRVGAHEFTELPHFWHTCVYLNKKKLAIQKFSVIIKSLVIKVKLTFHSQTDFNLKIFWRVIFNIVQDHRLGKKVYFDSRRTSRLFLENVFKMSLNHLGAFLVSFYRVIF